MTERVQKAQFDYFRLSGQTAIVTGSGNGIGRATAIMLADLGANVMVCDLEEDSARRVTEEILGRGGNAVFSPCNKAGGYSGDNRQNGGSLRRC